MFSARDTIKAGMAKRLATAKTWRDWNGRPHNRKKFVSASETAQCKRRIKYGKMLPDKPIKQHGFFERGHAVEAWVVEQIRHSGVNTMLIGEDQRTVHDGYQSGTPDGIFRLADRDILWECKSIDPRASTNLLPKQAHVWQVTQNMDLVNACYGFNITEAQITYHDASNFDIIHEHVVKFDPALAIMLEERAEEIMTAKRPEDLPADGVITGECGDCPFKDQCSGAILQVKHEKAKQKEAENVAKQLFG